MNGSASLSSLAGAVWTAGKPGGRRELPLLRTVHVCPDIAPDSPPPSRSPRPGVAPDSCAAWDTRACYGKRIDTHFSSLMLPSQARGGLGSKQLRLRVKREVVGE